MAESEGTQNDTQLVVVATEDMAVRAVNKRYEGLSTVRSKAIKGKGAWYWVHLEPILVRNPDTNDAKAVKLRCNLCEAVFSASNPSRTASEHLKRGTCPNFNSLLKPSSSSSSLPPLSSPSSHSNRKRFGSIGTSNDGLNSNRQPRQFQHHYPPHNHHHGQQHLLLSGGKEDLGPLAMLEDSVKKLKSPKPLPPGPHLSKTQVDSALGLLTDWFYESYGSVSFPSLDHPKFKAFMNQVGLPEISRQDFMSSRLDSKYEEAKLESEAKMRDAEFYQLVSDGWKTKTFGHGEEGLIKFMVNLPNGTTLFRKTFFPGGGNGTSMAVPATYAEEIMWETVTGVPPLLYCENLQNFSSISSMLDNTLSCARVLQLVVMDDSYKLVVIEDSVATEVAELVQNMGFWNDVEAVNTLIKVIRGMVEEIEAERPLVGQCLPLWEELRAKMKDWCAKYSIHEGLVEKIIERRFKKNYHPAWSTAFILDPVYLIRDSSGKYLPPFKYLTCEQEKDVDKLITRLVSREEAHIALMELLKWRSEGLDPLYAQAVQVKQRDPFTGKMKIANPQSSRLIWETILKELTILGKIAVRLLFLHATSCGFKCSWSFMRWVSTNGQTQSRVGLEKIQKMIFIAANSKLRRQEFGSEEEKEAEVFGITSSEDDDMLNEVFLSKPEAMEAVGMKKKMHATFHQKRT
ncbi:Ribonuclease H-like domain-containing protein, partial [Cynara cardunculus var. scolymus]